MEFISENWAFIVLAIAAIMNKLLQTNTAVSAFVNGSVESEI